jgi:hypothetical protein
MMTHNQIVSELYDHTEQELVAINRELISIIRSKRSQASATAKYQFRVGDAVEYTYQGRVEKGTIARILKTNAVVGGYRVPMSMLRKTSGVVNSTLNTFAKTQTATLTPCDMPEYLLHKLNLDAIFTKKPVNEPTTEAEIMNLFEYLMSAKEPENLSCDGEASRTHIRQTLSGINASWKWLEKKLGRKVTEEEVSKKIFARYSQK